MVNTPALISGSNLGLDTDYPEVFHGLPQFLQANAEMVP
jgi:hypothetical protein